MASDPRVVSEQELQELERKYREAIESPLISAAREDALVTIPSLLAEVRALRRALDSPIAIQLSTALREREWATKAARDAIGERDKLQDRLTDEIDARAAAEDQRDAAIRERDEAIAQAAELRFELHAAIYHDCVDCESMESHNALVTKWRALAAGAEGGIVASLIKERDAALAREEKAEAEAHEAIRAVEERELELSQRCDAYREALESLVEATKDLIFKEPSKSKAFGGLEARLRVALARARAALCVEVKP